MATDKTRVIAVRLPVEVADYYTEIGLREFLTDVAHGGKSVNTRSVNTSRDEIEGMCAWWGLSEDDFYAQIEEYFRSGEIACEDGQILLRPIDELNTTDFKNACAEKGKDPKKTLEEMTKMIWNIRSGGAGGA